MNNIEIEEDGNLRVTGKLKIKQLQTELFSEIVEEALGHFGIIGAAYNRYISDDGKLVGQEKANLVQGIENMTNTLISLRFFLEKNYLESNVIQAYDTEEGFNYTMHMDDYDFFLRGQISIHHYNEIKTFDEWYKKLFADKLNTFLKDLQVALKDKRLVKDEVIWLNKRLDTMIHSQIVMCYKLNHSRITV